MSPIPTLRPLGKTLGTEALGINLATALDAPTIAWIQQSFAEHPVLVFRDQNLGANELAAFGRIFGVPRKHSLVKYRHADNVDACVCHQVPGVQCAHMASANHPECEGHADSSYPAPSAISIPSAVLNARPATTDMTPMAPNTSTMRSTE